MPTPRPSTLHATLLGVSVLFGVNFVGMKIVLAHVPAHVWALLRVSAAMLVLVPLGLALNRRRSLPPLGVWLWLLPAAILGVGGNQLLFALGLERTTPAHSSVITACVPILTLGAAALAGQERITGAKLLGIALALSGVLTLLGIDRFVTERSDGSVPDTWIGDLLTVANATGYSIYLVMMRRIGRDVEAPLATAICFAYSTLFVLPFALPDLDAATLAPILAPGVLAWAIYAVLGSTVTTYLLNNWALRHADSSLVALYIYTQPVVATALSVALGHDAPGPRFFAAAVLVLAGLVASTRRRPEETPSPASLRSGRDPE